MSLNNNTKLSKWLKRFGVILQVIVDILLIVITIIITIV